MTIPGHDMLVTAIDQALERTQRHIHPANGGCSGCAELAARAVEALLGDEPCDCDHTRNPAIGPHSVRLHVRLAKLAREYRGEGPLVAQEVQAGDGPPPGAT